MCISDWSSDVCSSDLSPQNQFTASDAVFVAIRSVAFISPNVAQVRFIKRLQRDQQVIETPAIATLTFAVLSKPEPESGRYANRPGFQATKSRPDVAVRANRRSSRTGKRV